MKFIRVELHRSGSHRAPEQIRTRGRSWNDEAAAREIFKERIATRVAVPRVGTNQVRRSSDGVRANLASELDFLG